MRTPVAIFPGAPGVYIQSHLRNLPYYHCLVLSLSLPSAWVTLRRIKGPLVFEGMPGSFLWLQIRGEVWEECADEVPLALFSPEWRVCRARVRLWAHRLRGSVQWMKNLREILKNWQEHQGGKNQRRLMYAHCRELVQARCLAVLTSIVMTLHSSSNTIQRAPLLKILAGVKDCLLRRRSVIWDLKVGLSFKILLTVCHGVSVVSQTKSEQKFGYSVFKTLLFWTVESWPGQFTAHTTHTSTQSADFQQSQAHLHACILHFLDRKSKTKIISEIFVIYLYS